MYGLIYNYYTQNKNLKKVPCQWEFAASVDCDENVMSTRYPLGSGWNNTEPMQYPNPIPCTYKVETSGIVDNYQYNCSLLNGTRYINNYENSETVYQHRQDFSHYPHNMPRNDLFLGMIHLCDDTNKSNISGDNFYLASDYGTPASLGLSLFIGGNDPSYPASGVIPSTYGDPNRGGVAGATIPRYWVRLSLYNNDYVEQNRCFFDTTINYSGVFDITYMNISNFLSDYCGNIKLNSGVDFRNLSFNLKNPIIYNRSVYGDSCEHCTLNNLCLNLIPFDDCSDELYNGEYNSSFSNIIDTSGFPSLVSVTFSDINSEHSYLTSSQYRLRTCDASRLNDIFYLKKDNLEWYYPINEFLYDQSSYELDISDYNICSECERNPSINRITADIRKTSYTDGRMEVRINSESGNLVIYSRDITSFPISPGSYSLGPTYINSKFYPQIDCSGSTVILNIEAPFNKRCESETPSLYYAGSYDSNVAITIPSNYTDIGVPNPAINGTFVLNNGQYNGANFTLYLSGPEPYSPYTNSKLLLSIVESNYIWTGKYRYTFYSLDFPFNECFGSDVTNLIGGILLPYVNPITPGVGASSHETMYSTTGNALGSVVIS